MTMPTEKEFTNFRFFSSRTGHLVPRFTTFQSPVTQYIGASRNGKEIVWNEAQVTAISPAECRRYRKEIKQALVAGALKEVGVKDYLKWLEVEVAADAENEAAAAVEVTVDAKSASVNDEPTAEQSASAPKSVARKPKSGDVTK